MLTSDIRGDVRHSRHVGATLPSSTTFYLLTLTRCPHANKRRASNFQVRVITEYYAQTRLEIDLDFEIVCSSFI